MPSTCELSSLQLSTLLESPLFQGIGPDEAVPMLSCLGATLCSYESGETVLHAGEKTTTMGLVLSGSVIIQQVDVRGVRTILGRSGAKETFGEAFALDEGPLAADVVASTDCDLLLLNVYRVLSTCPSACAFHARLVRNLVTVVAQRNISLTRKIACTTPRTIRERVLAFLSTQPGADSHGCVRVPFNRQQLADYLCVDRSALCHELSQMRAAGTLDFDGNVFWFPNMKAI